MVNGFKLNLLNLLPSLIFFANFDYDITTIQLLL